MAKGACSPLSFREEPVEEPEPHARRTVVPFARVTAVARFRAHARRKVRLSSVLWHPRAGWQREAEVADLGLGGACVVLAETLAVGDKVKLSLLAPTLWDPLTIPGRIAWVGAAPRAEAGKAGVAFEPKDAKSMLALFELIGTFAYEH